MEERRGEGGFPRAVTRVHAARTCEPQGKGGKVHTIRALTDRADYSIDFRYSPAMPVEREDRESRSSIFRARGNVSSNGDSSVGRR